MHFFRYDIFSFLTLFYISVIYNSYCFYPHLILVLFIIHSYVIHTYNSAFLALLQSQNHSKNVRILFVLRSGFICMCNTNLSCIYLLKVDNGNTKTMCTICSKLRINTTERLTFSYLYC